MAFRKSSDVPVALGEVRFDRRGTTYFLSRQTLIPSRRPGRPIWQEHLFAAMVPNSETPVSFFKLPIDRVVELSRQIEI